MEPTKRRYDTKRFVVLDVNEKRYIKDEWIGTDNKHRIDYTGLFSDAKLFDSMATIQKLHQIHCTAEWHVTPVDVRLIADPYPTVIEPVRTVVEAAPRGKKSSSVWTGTKLFGYINGNFE